MRDATMIEKEDGDGRILFVLGFLAAALDMYDFLTARNFTVVGVILMLFHCMLCLCMPLRPPVPAWLGIIVYLAGLITPGFQATNTVFGMWLAIGTVFLYASPLLSTGLSGITLLVLFIVSFEERGQVDVLVVVAFFQVVSGLAGYAIRQRRLRAQARRRDLQMQTDELRLSQLERETLIASRLHDTLTNNLSTMITMSELHRLETTDSAELEYIDVISGRARDSMNQAHAVIDMLRGHEPARVTDIGTLASCLRDSAAALDAELARHGMHGDTRVIARSEAISCTPNVSDEVCGLLTELGNNLLRYGTGTYMVCIELDHTIHVCAMNEIGGHDDVVHRSGRGLSLHRETVERMGGKMRWGRDGDVWTVSVRIPCCGHDGE